MPEKSLNLETEARTFGRYLVGRVPPRELIERYERANRTLLSGPVSERDAALLAFIHRHSWSVSLLDAASGVLSRASLLRSKILIMSAILETSPAFADEFLPRTVSTPGLFMRLAALGLLAVARVAAGTVLYAVAGRSRS
jgi:hypothetical protein